MFEDPMFALATLSPCFIVIACWLLLRRRNRWLRLLGAGFSAFASPVIGFVLVMLWVDLSTSSSGNPGAGVAALPMLLVYFVAMIAVTIAELAWARNRDT